MRTTSNSSRSTRAMTLETLSPSLALLASLLCLSGQIEADTIVLTSGQRTEGVEIKTARWDQITYQKDGKNLSTSGERVVTIERQDTAIRRVRKPIDDGDYKKALSEIERYAPSAKNGVLAELHYLKGLALLQSGEPAEADKAFGSYLEQHKDSKDFWIPHAIYGRGQANLELERGGTAEEYFGQLGSFGATWALQSDLGRAQGAALAKDWQNARQLFAKVAGNSKAPLSVQLEARVGRIGVLVAQKQYANAIRDLDREFFKNPKPAELAYQRPRGEATLLMGRSFVEQGGKENLQEGEIWLLRAAVLYKGHPSVYQPACKHLAQVYEGLGRKDRAAHWKQLASGG